MATRTRTQPVTPAGELVLAARRHAGTELDQLREATTRLTELIRKDGSADLTPAVIDALAAHLADDAITGSIAPDRLDEINQAIRTHHSQVERSQVLNQAQAIIRSRITAATQGVADTGLRWLDNQLQGLLDESPTNAAEQYREIRLAQRVLTTDARGHHGNIDRDLRAAGITRTPCDVQYLRAIGTIVEHTTFTANGVRASYEPEPWPAAITDTDDLVPTRDHDAYLAWLIDRGDAWVPTVRELEEALQQRQRAIVLGVPVDQVAAEESDRRPKAGNATVTLGPGSGSDVRRDLARRGRGRGESQWP